MSRTPAKSRGRIAEAGFSLVELMVAITVFALIALAAYAVYDAARWSFEKGSQASDTAQRTRLGFDRMISDMRLMGYDFNTDGDQTPYGDTADEQLEFIGATAIAFRANFDYEDEWGGREYDPAQGPAEGDTGGSVISGYETSAAYLDKFSDDESIKGFPIVTTANDEIVVYALTKDGVNNCIQLKLDSSKPRDAEYDDLGVTGADNEETLNICGLALTHDNPPYTLERITLRDQDIGGSSGNNAVPESNLVRTPLADDIRSLDFRYFDAADRDFYCTNPNASDGSCTSGEVPFVDIGGSDTVTGGSGPKEGRIARTYVRRISVDLVGMSEKADFRYRDPEEDNIDSMAARHRKVRLSSDVTPPNLGRVGQLDLGALPPSRVRNVSACSGQCGVVRVQWEENPKEEQILGYVVKLYEVQCGTSNVITQITSKFVSGRDAYDNPGYLYTIFNGNDNQYLLDQSKEPVGNRDCIAAQVIAKNVNGEDGPPSDADSLTEDVEEPTVLSNEPDAPDTRKIYDETRPDPVSAAWASGVNLDDYSDTDGVPNDNSDIAPESDATSEYYPEANRVLLEWEAPNWVLDESSGAPVTNSGTAALPNCHVEDTEGGAERTPLEELNGLAEGSEDLDDLESAVPEGEKQGRYLIFRSTEENFRPTDRHLIAVVDSTSYEDRTWHHFKSDGGGSQFQYTDAFPVENCIRYFYRIRVADDCWDGANPAGDNPAGGDYSHDNLSPFYPPLNPANSDDTDALGGGDTPGAAIIGYSRPAGAPTKVEDLKMDAFGQVGSQDYFFLSFDAPKTDDSGNWDAEREDENHFAVGTYRVYGHKTTKDFTVPADSPTCPNPPCSLSGTPLFYYGEVRIHTDITGAGNLDTDGVGTPLSAKQAGIRHKKIGHHDEDGNNAGTNTPPASWNVELPFEDESAVDKDGLGAKDSGDTALRFPLHDNGGNPWFFKVVAVQCKGDEASPFRGNDEDDGEPSDFIQIPCTFGEAINGLSEALPSGGTVAKNRTPIDSAPTGDVQINGGSCPGGLPQQINVTVSDDQGDIRACQARLVLRSGVTGDTVVSSWRYWTDGTGSCTEDQDAACPDDRSFWSRNEFCWKSSEVEDLMSRIRGRDVRLFAEVRESIQATFCPGAPFPCITDWYLPCIGTAECPSLVVGSDCIQVLPQIRGQTASTYGPLIQNDDFTGDIDPISGEPNGLPDGIVDCYQSAHWLFGEACANGALDIKTVQIRWRDVGGGQCDGQLLRAYWDWSDADKEGIILYQSPDWPEDGAGNGNVTVCDSTESCSNQVSCTDAGPEGCLYLSESDEAILRLEFDQGASNSAKNCEVQVDINYDRVEVTGATSNITQTFGWDPTAVSIPDTCNPCDQDNDGATALAGTDLEGNLCNTADPGACSTCDCDDLNPDIGAAPGGDCCDYDNDGYEWVGALADGSLCGNTQYESCTPEAEREFGLCLGLNDCDDDDDQVNPCQTEGSANPGSCSDGIDNDCDCSIDGLGDIQEAIDCNL